MIILIRAALVLGLVGIAVWLFIDYSLLILVGSKAWFWIVAGFKTTTKWLALNLKSLLTRSFAGRARKWLVGTFFVTGLVNLFGGRRARLIYGFGKYWFRRARLTWQGLSVPAKVSLVIAVAALSFLFSGSMLLFFAIGYLIDRFLFVPARLQRWFRNSRVFRWLDGPRRAARLRYIRQVRSARPKVKKTFDRLMDLRQPKKNPDR